MKLLGPWNRVPVKSAAGQWLPVFTLGDFEAWIIRYSCNHGQMIQFREGTPAGAATIRAAMGQMAERRTFYCANCPYDGGHVLITAVRRLR